MAAAVVTTGARPLPSGCRSISAAPSALVAVPTAAPCSARAANSSPTPCAARNNPHAPAAMARPGQDHAAAAQVVRQRPEHQQGDRRTRSVGGEHGGQRDRREPPLSLVDAVQRRRGRRREEQQEQHPGHQPERGRPRQHRLPGRFPGGSRDTVETFEGSHAGVAVSCGWRSRKSMTRRTKRLTCWKWAPWPESGSSISSASGRCW